VPDEKSEQALARLARQYERVLRALEDSFLQSAERKERDRRQFERMVQARQKAAAEKAEIRERTLRQLRAEDDVTAAAPPRPPIPNESQIGKYAHASLQKAVKGFDAGDTKADVARAARLPPEDARRVRLMLGARLLSLNDKRKLFVDGRVAQLGSRYALRYIDESGTRWLDPLKELKDR
jgi:hypothetical protein